MFDEINLANHKNSIVRPSLEELLECASDLRRQILSLYNFMVTVERNIENMVNDNIADEEGRATTDRVADHLEEARRRIIAELDQEEAKGRIRWINRPEVAPVTDNTELRERVMLLEQIKALEASSNWTPIEELRERVNLLNAIQEAEEKSNWTPLEELQERADLLGAIDEAERR